MRFLLICLVVLEVSELVGEPMQKESSRGYEFWWYRQKGSEQVPTRDLQYVGFIDGRVDVVSGYTLTQNGSIVVKRGDSEAETVASLGQPVNKHINHGFELWQYLGPLNVLVYWNPDHTVRGVRVETVKP